MKGQFVALLTLFVFIFIVSGNVFGAILFQDDYSEEIKYSIGNYNTIAEAQVRGERYIPRMETEMNYSSNIMAFRIGMSKGEYEGLEDTEESENDISWGYNTPDPDLLEEEFRKATKDHLKTQNDVFQCSNPVVDAFELEKKPLNMDTTFNDNWINCTSTGAEASIRIPDEASTMHEKNRYLQLAQYAVEFSRGLSDDIDDYVKADVNLQNEEGGPITAAGFHSEDRCPGRRPLTKRDAEDDAEDDIPGAKDDFGKVLFEGDKQNRPDWIGLDNQDTEFTSSIIKSSSITDSGPCCVRPKYDDQGNRDGCIEDTNYNAEATAAATEVKIDFVIKDAEKNVVDSQGDERSIKFKFTKIEDVPASSD